MKKNKAVALVLAASASTTMVLAKNAVTANADTMGKSNTKVKNVKTYTNKGRVVNVTSDLRVREGASTKTMVLGYLHEGNTFNIVAKEGNWYKIEVNDSYGYVYGEYVEELNGSTPKNSYNNINSSEGQIVNIETNLRFRSKPSEDSNVIGYFVKGQIVNVVGKTGNWYKIKYDGHTGYADGKYINIINASDQFVVLNEPNDNIVKEHATGKVHFVETDLRIRSRATTASTIIGRLHEGNIVNIIGRDGDWYKISQNGLTGFVCSDYIRVVKDRGVVTENNLSTKTVKAQQTGMVNVKNVQPIAENVSNTVSVEKSNNNEQAKNNVQNTVQTSNNIKRNNVEAPVQNNENSATTNVNSNTKLAEKVAMPKATIIQTSAPIVNNNDNSRNEASNNIKETTGAKEVTGVKVSNGAKETTGVKEVTGVKVSNGVKETTGVKEATGTKESAGIKGNKQTATNKENDSQKTNTITPKTGEKGQNTNHNKTVVKNDSNNKSETIKKDNDKKIEIKHLDHKTEKNTTIQQPIAKKVVKTTPKVIVENTVGTVVNVNSCLLIRTGASINTSIIGRLYEGSTVNITGKIGDWYRIDNNGQVGYVYGAYIHLGIIKPKANKTPQTVARKAFGEVINVNSDLLIRSGASTNTAIIGSLSDGETFKIIGIAGDWYKISKDGQVGYVFGEYVKLVDSEVANSSNNNSTNRVVSENAIGHVINIESNLRIRTAPNTTSSVMGYLLNGQTVTITGKEGIWYRIRVNGSTGYVYGGYIALGAGQKVNDIHANGNTGNAITYNHKYGEVINVESSLRIRTAPSLNSTVIGYLLDGQGFKVLGKVGNWYKIENNDQVGYASANYIKLVDHLINNENNNGGSVSNNSGNREANFETLFSILKEQVGSPYIWGAEGQEITYSSLARLKREFPGEAAAGDYNIPARYIDHGYRGFDCSGLMDWAFSQLGINIGRTTYQQVTAGREVPLNDVRPGDLLFFKGAYHVGLYIGNGKWLVSPHSHAYVRICNVPWSMIGRARRVLN